MYKKHGDANENKLKNRSIATAKMRSDEKIRGYDDDTDITKNQSPYHTNLHIIQTCVQINAYSCHTTSFSMKIFMLFINRNRLFFLSIFLSHSPCFSSRKILKSLMLEMCYFADAGDIACHCVLSWPFAFFGSRFWMNKYIILVFIGFIQKSHIASAHCTAHVVVYRVLNFMLLLLCCSTRPIQEYFLWIFHHLFEKSTHVRDLVMRSFILLCC